MKDIAVLDLSKASAILVRRGSGLELEDVTCADWMPGTPNLPVIMVDDLSDISAIEEHVMRAAGWVRADA